MGGKDVEQRQLEPQQEIVSSNYVAQRHLDFRLAHIGALRIITPGSDNEKHDFEIAIGRRSEPEGATLEEMARKFGLE